MLAAVRGVVVGVLPDGVFLEVGPITLQIAVSHTTLGALPRDGTPVRLVTHLYLREDQMALYGFTTETELGLFRLLLGVTGVGPKVALNVCGSGEPDLVLQTIAAGDSDALARIPGIGKKTAARLILELRGKLDALAGGALPVSSGPSSQQRDDSSDVIAALQALGYSATEAYTALRDAEIAEGMTVEERVLTALRQLGQKR
ncbi:MAG: Holliday junction branch migration protein RuvA [Thermomicrobia bacterium]|nr:Holliday junction branch migration protein RuvA [Thermomicrobia bacterium]MCA1723352.1 Holliday junction branch migration protein RuvA [Thermomicrobia bacterium]